MSQPPNHPQQPQPEQPQPWGQPNPWASPDQGRAGGPWGQPAQPGQQPGGYPGPGYGAHPPGGGYGAQRPGGYGGYVAPPKPGIIPLRPLGLGEILDGAFQACRRNAAATFGSAVLVQAVLALLGVALLGSLMFAPGQLESLSTATDAEALSWVASIMGGASILSLFNVIAVLVLQGVLVIPVARAILNLKTGFGSMWRMAGRKILPLIGLGVVMIVATVIVLAIFIVLMVLTVMALEEQSIIIVILSVLVLIAAAVWISVNLALAPAAMILDGTGVFASIGRSWILIRGNWWRTFGILALTTIIVQVIASVISTPISFLASLLMSLNTTASADPETAMLQSLPVLVVTSLITAVFAAIGLAFQAAVTSLLYVDLRIRREGFDITLMKEHEAADSAGPDVLPGHSVRRSRTGNSAGHGSATGPWTQ